MPAGSTTGTREQATDRSSVTGDRYHARIIWAVIVVLTLAVCIRPMGSSLWLDELGTWWVVKDGVRDVISRSWEIQGQSPFYYLIAWATRDIAGTREWALRLPSLFFGAATAMLVYRLGRRMVDAECGRLSVLMLVAIPGLSFAAIDFRPYALATFLATATVAAFVVWLDEGSRRWAAAFVLAGATTVYAHYLFGLVLVSLLVYALWSVRRRRTGHVTIGRIVSAFVAIAILCAPLAIQVLALWQRRSDWTQGESVSVEWIATVVLPPVFVVGVSIGVLLAATQGGLAVRWPPARSGFIPLCVCWIAVPITILVATTLLSDADIALARYALVSAPAIALLLGCALETVTPPAARRIIAISMAIVVVLAVGRAHHAVDWRGSMDATRGVSDPQSLVIVQSGFTESNQSAWLADPERRSFLLAPLSLYPVEGNVVLLPLDPNVQEENEVRREIVSALPDASNVVLINGGSLERWVREMLGPDGWQEQQVPTDDEPFVKMFTRDPS
jgi:4-amino-4-deoxy-L-arabinose transferase-like glycosyltransferase